jgi:hypothetical protein
VSISYAKDDQRLSFLLGNVPNRSGQVNAGTPVQASDIKASDIEASDRPKQKTGKSYFAARAMHDSGRKQGSQFQRERR